MKLEEYDAAREEFYKRMGYYPSFGQLKNYLQGYHFGRPQQPTEQQIIPKRRRRPWK